jgi:polyhydroxyalkanoate synthesis regulator protein
MLSLRALAFAATAFTFGLTGCAQTSVDRNAPLPHAAPAAGMPMGGSGEHMARMDEQMKTMQSMHDKMMQSMTPEQRSALMAEHMKVMQDSMAMMGGMMEKGGMGGMGGMGAMSGMHGKGAMEGGMGMDRQMTEKHMQMMQSMMQMMTDRMPPAPAKP